MKMKKVLTLFREGALMKTIEHYLNNDRAKFMCKESMNKETELDKSAEIDTERGQLQ